MSNRSNESAAREIDVSVVIPVFNRFDRLAICLEALRAQRTDRSFEVIVVDDGSTEDSNALRRHFERLLPLHWLTMPRNGGPAKARNAGIKAARGTVVCFTDSDCKPEPQWLEALAAPFANPAVRGCKGVYRTAQTDRWARLAQIEFEERYNCLRACDDIDFIDTYSGAFRRCDLEAVGGFDESFPGADNEDVDLSFRIKAMGGRFLFLPKAVVWHQHREGPAAYARLKFARGFWRMKVYRRHLHKAGRDSYTPWTLKLQLLLGIVFFPLVALRKGWRWWAAGWGTTCLPLVRIAMSHDLALVPWVPVLTLIRCGALLGGMLQGLIDRR
jgi:GT2 family glycosyltransferase